MNHLEHLTPAAELKTSLLEWLAKANNVQLGLSYDSDSDALVMRFAPTANALTHYVDHHIALLYQSDTKEIVALKIEGFNHSFLALHEPLQKVWRLSESNAKIENVGDLILVLERKTPEIAREIIKATEALLELEGVKLGAILST